MKNKAKSKQVNKNLTALVRIDAGLKYLLKKKAADDKTTIRALVEGSIVEILGEIK
jgi:hypothetical protein